MKAEEVLKLVQKMYRKKKFILDDEQENILEDNSRHYTYMGSNHYSGEKEECLGYTEDKKHFCTIEFAKRMFKKIIP